MAKQTSSTVIAAKSRFGWRWILVLIGGLAWVSIGCNPQSLSAFLMPFSDNNTPPEYKLFAVDKQITLAIVANFARPEIHPDLQAADAELAELVADTFRKRCADNKHKIKIVPIAQVRSQELKQRQLTGGDISAVEIGKSLKADFILEMNVNYVTIYEKNTYPRMYRGQTDISVNLFKVDAKDGEHKVFTKEYPRIYPAGSGPIDASSMSSTMFRRGFLTKVANDISKMFIAYPPDEAHQLE
jgi:hypothetical protein